MKTYIISLNEFKTITDISFISKDNLIILAKSDENISPKIMSEILSLQTKPEIISINYD